MADIALANSTYSTGTNDTASTLVNNVTSTDAQQWNGVATGVVGIETILGTGTTLKGNLADLVARLAVALNADGQMKLSTDASVVGPLSTAKGGTGLTYDIVPTGTMLPYSMRVAPTGFLVCNGAAVSRATYATLFALLHQSATITVTIASPGVVTWTSHTLENGDPVVFTTTGALPTGITAGTTYYVVNKGAGTFQIAATPGGAAINTSGTQSGVHTGIHAPYGRGDGSTTFNVPDLRGRVLVAADNLGGTAASRITSSSTNGANSTGIAGVGGAETHTLQQSEIPAHTHTYISPTGGAANTITTGGGSTTNASGATGSIGGGGAHSNTQPWLAASYIIKY